MNDLPVVQRVPANRGWRWIAEGWRLVLRKPATWFVFALVTWAITELASLHLLLLAAIGVLMPVLTGGWILAAREADAGRPIPVNMLFAGFGPRIRDLAAIGGVNMMGTVLMMLVMFAVGGDELGQLMTHPESVSADQARDLQGRMSVALLLVMAIGIPLGMAVWFAPVAVVMHGQKAGAALGASLRGILRNSLPFLFYGLVLSVIAVFAYALLTLVLPDRAVAMKVAFWALMPLIVTSVYASYRDIFRAPAAAAPETDA